MDARRHNPVALGGGWVECRRCGTGWAEDDDEARGKPLVCDPGAVRFGDGEEDAPS